MKNEVKINEIIIVSIAVTAALIFFDIYAAPNFNIRLDFISKLMQKSISEQVIAPNRLYINVWRTAKNVYAGSSMNNQNWTRWRNRYLKHIKTFEDADIAINTMLASLNDPYTRFMSADLFSRHKAVLKSKIKGTGIVFSKPADNFVINRVMDNSPAESAGIKKGDIIVSINGEKADEAHADILADGKGDEVDIVVKRGGVLIYKKLKKQEISFKTMKYFITEDNIGVITIASISGEDAADDFKEILEKTNNTRALIIDLRNNYGGILANAAAMINYMIDYDKIISVDTGRNQEFEIYSAGGRIFRKKPVIMLINKRTASAAEIFAGALRVHTNEIILGENSFGKNSIQRIIPMHCASGLIITSHKYILPDGSDIYGRGLTPDIYLKQSSNANDIQMLTALKILRSTLDNPLPNI